MFEDFENGNAVNACVHKTKPIRMSASRKLVSAFNYVPAVLLAMLNEKPVTTITLAIVLFMMKNAWILFVQRKQKWEKKMSF